MRKKRSVFGRIIAFIFIAAALVLTLTNLNFTDTTAIAVSAETEAPAESEPAVAAEAAEETAAPVVTATPEPTAEPAHVITELTYDYDTQLKLIEDGIGDWTKKIDYAMNPCFNITDLDQDGLLEINIFECQGSGMFTYYYIYEVNAALDGIREVANNLGDSAFAPDSFYDYVTAAASGEMTGCFDPDTGIFYYGMYDVLRNGIAEHYTTYYLVNEEENALNYEELGIEHYLMNTDNTESDTWILTDGTEFTIEGELFAAILEDLSVYQETVYTFVTVTSYDEGTFAENLLRSAQGWSLRAAD